MPNLEATTGQRRPDIEVVSHDSCHCGHGIAWNTYTLNRQ